MQLLILGGTAWLGSHLVKAGLKRGHEVTCLARGESGDVLGGATFVRANRDLPGAYDAAAANRWDSVIGVSRQPGQVLSAVSALNQSSKTYVFVSSTNVYANHAAPGEDEHAEVLPALESDVMASMDEYGRAKVACERFVQETVGKDRALIVRVGLIGGPGDEFDRTGYWPLRFALAKQRNRDVLVPDIPEQATQVIDVRDLADWLVDCACRGVTGVLNATGATTRFDEHVRKARSVVAHEGPVKLASPEWLSAHGVAPWMGKRSLPLWLPVSDHAGFSARICTKAIEAGLLRRDLEETLRDTLDWELARQSGKPRRAGLSDVEEDELLVALAASAA
ncbi:MAG: NAD-dependent epimerase/dehydratase family protein [Burkholderiaceae bacterium]